MKINQLKTGTILSYLQMGLTIVMQLIYIPAVIRFLGKNEYGLYNTAASAISVLSILSLGFNNGYIRYFALYRKENNHAAISRLNGLFLIIFMLIGLAALLCGLFLSFHLNLVFGEGLTAEEYKTAKILTLLLTFNLAVSFPMSVFQDIISAHEKFVFLKLLGMAKTIFCPLITLPLLTAGFRSVALVTVSVSVSLSVDAVYFIYVIFIMKEKFVFRNFEKKIFISLFGYTFFIALNILIDQINWNIDKLLLGRFLGTGEVAIYAVGYTLYQSYMVFSTSVSGVFTPRIHKIINHTKNNPEKQKEELTALFIKVGRIQFLILGLISTGVLFFGKYFIVELWAGKDYDKAYYVALLLIFPASAALIQNLGIEIQRAQNKHQFRSIVYTLMAFLNLGISIYLCQKYGAVGSTVGTAFSLTVANGLIMNIYYNQKCNIDIPLFWKNILHQSVGLIAPVALGILLLNFVHIDSITKFLGDIFLYTAVYCISMWIFGMNPYEKALVIKPLKKIFHQK